MVTSYPAWRRLMPISSAIADSSSTTRMRLMVSFLSADHCLDGRDGIVADVRALDHVDDHLGQVLGVVAHALDGLGDEHEVDAGRDGARIFHHERDELAQEALELLVDLVVLLQH